MLDVLARTVDALHPAGHQTARDMTPRFRDHAERRGMSADLVPHLAVHWNEHTTQFELGVDDEKHRQAFDDAEYGGLDGRPGAYARSFDRELQRHAARVFDEHLARRL